MSCPSYDYSDARLRFFSVEGLDRDSSGRALAEFRELGDEMIVYLQDDGTAVGTTVFGEFVFGPGYEPSRISPYASLEELTRVRFRDGHYRVG